MFPKPQVIQQVLLVAAPYLAEIAPALRPGLATVTWETLHDVYSDVAAPYWLAVLANALGQWRQLRTTTWGPGTTFDAQKSGSQIEAEAQLGKLDGWWLGRSGGLGAVLVVDMKAGAWPTRRYRLRKQPTALKDWTPLEDVLGLVPLYAIGQSSTGLGSQLPSAPHAEAEH